MSTKKTHYNATQFPRWAILVVVSAIVVAGLVFVYNSFASARPPAGYTATTLYCKEGRCTRTQIPGFRETRGFAKAASTGFGGQACITGVVYRGTTQASRMKAPANDQSKDMCVLTDVQIQFPNGV